MSIEIIFNLCVVVFTVASLFAMGLELELREAMKTLRSARAILLILFWGWIVGPILAWLITWILPVSDAYAAGLLLISMAPTAPFYPMMVARAEGDMSAGAAYMLIAILATVVLMPLLAPIVITGVAVDAWSLAKPLIVIILLPLLVGIGVQVYLPRLGAAVLPATKRLATLFLIITLILTFWLYGREMLSAVGSFAPLSMVLFLVAITVFSNLFSAGLDRPQRSSMALAMCTRNVTALLAGYFGITDPPEDLFVIIILIVPLTALIAFVSARIFAQNVSAN
ncbi:MAG: bile acid:sodium symporter [Boseongicola sp.]